MKAHGAASEARARQVPGGGRGAGGALTKVVLARRSDVRFRGRLDPLALLATLQARAAPRRPTKLGLGLVLW